MSLWKKTAQCEKETGYVCTNNVIVVWLLIILKKIY